MMLHTLQDASSQKFERMLSPTLHLRKVPCQSRLLFPPGMPDVHSIALL